MLLLIDNYDSFTYNLVQYLGEMQVELQVHRNDQISLDQIRALQPERILISPGPCSPRESGLSNEIIRSFSLACTRLTIRKAFVIPARTTAIRSQATPGCSL